MGRPPVTGPPSPGCFESPPIRKQSLALTCQLQVLTRHTLALTRQSLATGSALRGLRPRVHRGMEVERVSHCPGGQDQRGSHVSKATALGNDGVFGDPAS